MSFSPFGLLSISSVQFFKVASNGTPVTSLRELFCGSVVYWEGTRGTGEMECSCIPLEAATEVSACVIYDIASHNGCFENTYFLQACNRISLLAKRAAKGKYFF